MIETFSQTSEFKGSDVNVENNPRIREIELARSSARRQIELKYHRKYGSGLVGRMVRHFALWWQTESRMDQILAENRSFY